MRGSLEKGTYTVRGIANKLGLGKNATYEALRRGEIPALRIGRRYIIPRAAFDEFLASAGKPEGR